MLPTLRQLQYLKLLSEHGSFSRAAEAAHVSQPALSSGVQELERVLGAPVVERTRGNVQLTAVGAEACRRAEDVLARTEDLVEAAKNAGRPLSGRLRLGIIPTVAPFLLPATQLTYLGLGGVLSYDALGLVNSGFYNRVRNPNAKSSCGCGVSFSI